MTDGHLGPGDLQRTETHAPVVGWRFNAVEHEVCDDVSEHKCQAADEPLSTSEVTATRSTAYREPDVLVVDTTEHAHTTLVISPWDGCKVL